MKRNNKKGFTIVELVIVIAVIAILAGVMIPTFGSIITKANESKEFQQASAAYKNALAEELADDGVIGDAENTQGNYTFTWADDVLTSVTGNAGYTYNVTDGALTGVTKN